VMHVFRGRNALTGVMHLRGIIRRASRPVGSRPAQTA
jgi:hypothetical protein